MTNEEIDQMAAGRELDRLIAEKVMGWKLVDPIKYPADKYCGFPPGQQFDYIPKYSTEIAAAWPLMERITKDKRFYYGVEMITHLHSNGWLIVVFGESKKYHDIYVFAETAPLAICRATLKASILGPKRVDPPSDFLSAA